MKTPLSEMAFVPQCEACGCDLPVFTTYSDGAGLPWDLCEYHGDLLAVGFPTKLPARQAS